MTDQANGPPPGEQASAVATAEQLVAARERRAMSKPEVAQRLRLHPRQLDAIERGDWAALPGRAFARGAVRSYGRLLGVDVAPLLDAIGGFAEPEDLRPSTPLAAPLPRGGGFGFDVESHRSKLPWAILGVIGVIAVALFFGRDGDVSKVTSWIGSSQPPGGATAPGGGTATGAGAGGISAPSVPAPAGVPLVPPPLVPPPASVQPSTTAVPSSGASTAGAPGPTSGVGTVDPGSAAPAGPLQGGAAAAGAAGAPAAPGIPAVTPPPPPPIRITVRQDAWVDVRQADGRSVFMGTVKPSTPLEVKGQAPYSLTIGNASEVTLEFEGNPIDLKPRTVLPNNIARVKLP